MAKRISIRTIVNLAILATFAVALVVVSTGDHPPEDDRTLTLLHHYLNLARSWHASDNAHGMLLFATAMFLSSTIGLPPPGVIAIGGAALIGFWPAVLIALPSNALGAACSFSISRYLFRPLVERKFSEHLVAMKDGVEKDGAWYLFSLRLVPLVPFPIVNMVLGVTTIKLMTFGLVTLIGRIPLTLLYCNAGLHLGSIHNTQDIMTPRVVLSLAALAFAPLGLRWLLDLRKSA